MCIVCDKQSSWRVLLSCKQIRSGNLSEHRMTTLINVSHVMHSVLEGSMKFTLNYKYINIRK